VHHGADSRSDRRPLFGQCAWTDRTAYLQRIQRGTIKITGWCDWLIVCMCLAWLAAVAAIASGPSGGFIQFITSQSTAGWAQAIGTVGAIWATWNVANGVAERERERERNERRMRALALHAQALGLAQLAVNCLAKAEAALSPVTDLGQLRNVVETELAVVDQFPVWKLPNGEAMVIFAAFPGLLLQCVREIERAEKRPSTNPLASAQFTIAALKRDIHSSYEICTTRERDLRSALEKQPDVELVAG
jgi:hypothetical protein